MSAFIVQNRILADVNFDAFIREIKNASVDGNIEYMKLMDE